MWAISFRVTKTAITGNIYTENLSKPILAQSNTDQSLENKLTTIRPNILTRSEVIAGITSRGAHLLLTDGYDQLSMLIRSFT